MLILKILILQRSLGKWVLFVNHISIFGMQTNGAVTLFTTGLFFFVFAAEGIVHFIGTIYENLSFASQNNEFFFKNHFPSLSFVFKVGHVIYWPKLLKRLAAFPFLEDYSL